MDYKIVNKYGHCCFGFEEDYAHIYNLYIKKECRRQGNGRNLLEFVIKRIRCLGWEDAIYIVAQPTENSISNKELINFYRSCGLQVYSSCL